MLFFHTICLLFYSNHPANTVILLITIKIPSYMMKFFNILSNFSQKHRIFLNRKYKIWCFQHPPQFIHRNHNFQQCVILRKKITQNFSSYTIIDFGDFSTQYDYSIPYVYFSGSKRPPNMVIPYPTVIRQSRVVTKQSVKYKFVLRQKP